MIWKIQTTHGEVTSSRQQCTLNSKYEKGAEAGGVVATVLTKTGETVWEQKMMYKTVVKAVLLYRRDSWVVTEVMLEVLEGFHHRVSWRIAGKSDRQVGEEGWGWSSVVEALEAAGMWFMKEHIWRRQSNIAEYITKWPISELCMGAERMPGSSRFMRWWK